MANNTNDDLGVSLSPPDFGEAYRARRLLVLAAGSDEVTMPRREG